MGAPPPPPPPSQQPPSGQPPAYGQPAYGQPAYGQPPPYYAEQSQTNGIAVAALIVGILSLPAVLTIVFGALLGIVAIVLGIVALTRAGQTGGSGRGMAIGGIVTGGLAVLATVLVFAGLVAVGGAIVESGVLDEIEQQGGPVFDQ